MSADDFQSKYASVMESMLKSAVAETTKLFETMVDELKAEISRIKKENEDLKTRCSQFESARNRLTVDSRESEPPPGQSDSSERRDTAVQCDLVPLRTMLVEQCHPLQNQQYGFEEMEYALQEHDYDTRGEGNSQMAFIVVKQEAVLKQEEIESTVVCGQILRNRTDSPWASPCQIENEGPFINKVCSTREMPLLQRHEETQVALELPFLGTHSGVQAAQNQSSELEHSLVISLAAIKDDMEEEPEVSPKIAEVGTQGELMLSEKEQLVVSQHQSEVEPLEKQQPSVVPQQCQREGETSINEQTDVTLQQHTDVQSTQEQLAQPTPLNKGEACEELKQGVAEVGVSSQPDLSVPRRRGRPPKKAKRLKPPVKEILQSPSLDIPTGQEGKKYPAIREEEVEVSSRADTVTITSSESPQTCPVQTMESSSIITPSIKEKVNTASEDVENSKVGSLASSETSSSRRRSSKKEKSSESQQLSMDMEEGGTIQASSTKVSSAIETLNSPSAETPQSPSVQSRERCSSVTLQDAMLLIEAMNQSTVENTSSSPQRKAAPPQTQSAPCGGAMQTVTKVPTEPQTPPVETHKAVGNPPVTELSPAKTTGATPTDEAQAPSKVVIPKHQHTGSLSSTTTSSSLPLSTSATQTSVQSLQQHRTHPLITSVAPNRQGNVVPHKIIVVPRSVSTIMPQKVAAQSSTQLPTVLSTVVVSQNRSILPHSTAAGLPLGTPSRSSVPQKTIYVPSSKLLPVVTQSTATSTDSQSGTPLNPKMTIIIPRQMSAVASMKQKSQTSGLTAQQESAKSATSVMVVMSSSQSISSSKESSVSMDTQTALEKVASILSQKRDNTSVNLESPKQTSSVSETINAHTQTCSSLNMSVGLVPTTKSPALSPAFEEKCSAVVRLTRLPFPLSATESVMVSRLPTNGSPDSQSILKEGTSKEKSSSVVISTQPSEIRVLSTDICFNVKETPVSVNTSQMSEEPNDIQENASLSSESCTTLEDSSNSGYVQPSPSSKVSQTVFEKSIMDIDITELSAVSATAGALTSNLDQEIISIAVHNSALPKDGPVEEKQSAALIHLSSITSKDTSDPHLQMTKTQFLAQLAVSPIAQDPKKASSNDPVDARSSCAETSTGDKKRLQQNSLIAQLRSHIKTHLQARRTETNPERCTETDIHPVRPKKPRLENDHPNDKNTTSERIPLRPKNTGAIEDVTSLKKTTNDPTFISPRRSGLCIDGVQHKMTVSESSSVSSRRCKTTSESTPLSPKRLSSGRDGVGSRNVTSTSVSPRKSSSTKESVTLKRMKNTSGSLRKSCSIKESATPKKTKSTSLSSRSSSTRDGAGPKNTKTGVSPNNTKTSSVRHKRTTSSRDGASPKKTKSTSGSPRASSLSKNGTSPKMSTDESSSFCRRKCTLTKDGSSTKEIKRESNSFSPQRCSTTTDGANTKTTKSETDSPSIRWPKLAKDGVSPRETGESTSVKKPGLIQDGTSPKKNLRVVNSSGQAVKKCKAKAVWTPPRMPASKTAPAGGKRSVQLPVKKDTVSPGSSDHPVVYPPSVSLFPIPVRAPPVVSPSQPLSVIGWRLLKNQCGECGRVLSSSAALESHVSLHKGRRPFSCSLCGKRFPDSKALKRHGRVHRNGRIHICQQCGKGFVYRFSLTKHLQMVHGRLKPFVCQICEKGFFTKRDVEAHIRIHTGEKPFHCNLCEKKFARRVELNVHLRWHNGEKRHWCPYCGKGFLDFNNLKRHKYIHTGEKPHSCPHCPKNFTQSGHLKKHVKNVHKIQ